MFFENGDLILIVDLREASKKGTPGRIFEAFPAIDSAFKS